MAVLELRDLLSTIKKLRQDGFAKWVTAYLVSLFGSVIWVGLVLLVSLETINRMG